MEGREGGEDKRACIGFVCLFSGAVVSEKEEEGGEGEKESEKEGG